MHLLTYKLTNKKTMAETTEIKRGSEALKGYDPYRLNCSNTRGGVAPTLRRIRAVYRRRAGAKSEAQLTREHPNSFPPGRIAPAVGG